MGKLQQDRSAPFSHPLPRENRGMCPAPGSLTHAFQKAISAWAPTGNEGFWTGSWWWVGAACLEQVKELEAFLLPWSKENEKASWKALRNQGPALVASGLKSGDPDTVLYFGTESSTLICRDTDRLSGCDDESPPANLIALKTCRLLDWVYQSGLLLCKTRIINQNTSQWGGRGGEWEPDCSRRNRSWAPRFWFLPRLTESAGVAPLPHEYP